DGLGLPVPKFVEDPLAHGQAALEGVAEMPEAAGDETQGLVARARKRLEDARADIADDEANTLFLQGVAAQRKGTREALQNACNRYEQAVAKQSRFPEALYNWGTALGDIGELVTAEDPEAARGYYEQAGEKYQQALEIKPDKHEALNNWGIALGDLAGLVAEEDAEAARQYYEQAGEKYQQALEIKPDKHEALYNWGIALDDLARLVAAKEPEAVRGYYEDACEKYEQA
ncbi:unnamed protein product, partial [marine sediment metagenome]